MKERRTAHGIRHKGTAHGVWRTAYGKTFFKIPLWYLLSFRGSKFTIWYSDNPRHMPHKVLFALCLTP